MARGVFAGDGEGGGREVDGCEFGGGEMRGQSDGDGSSAGADVEKA